MHDFNRYDNQYYPTQRFPDSLSRVIDALHLNVEAPVELIGGTILSAISLACQPFIEVKFPDGRVKPTSIYSLILANSGERKSTVYNLVMKPFLDFEKKDKDDYSDLLNEYNAEMLAWNIRKKTILKSIRKKTETNESYKNEIKNLKEHLAEEPLPPKKMKLIYSDSTPEAIQRGLYDNISSAGLMSDEASIFFEGRAKNNLGFLNQLWDGASFDVERRNQKNFSVNAGRFTMLLMVQPEVFMRYFKRHGAVANDIGFLARFLISPTLSNQGYRRSEHIESNQNTLRNFHSRVENILLNLRGHVDKKEQPIIIELSSDARVMLQTYQQNMEHRIQIHGGNNAVVYYLSKAPENAVRISALFHYFDGKENDYIHHETLSRAISIMEYYNYKAIELFSTKVSSPEQDAQCVYNWLISKLGDPKITRNFIAKAEVRRLIHKHLRDYGRLNAAIKILEKEDKIWIDNNYNSNGSVTQMIHFVDV